MQIPRFYRYQPRCALEVAGPDARSFLQGQFSNDLSKLERGGMAYGLWLNRKGKVVADSFALCRGEEEFLLLSYYCEEGVVYDRLEAYLVMEEAELLRSDGAARGLSVLGESAQSALCAELGIEVPEPAAFSSASGVVAFWGRRCSEPVLEFVFLEPSCNRKADALLEQLDAFELSAEAVKILAIKAMVPTIGMGFGATDLPQELALEGDAVSFRKGCYLGQEVMARLHAMGKVRKELRGLSILNTDTEGRDALPLDLFDAAGKRQGQLRSLAYTDEGALGLAVVNSGFEGKCLQGGTLSGCVIAKRILENG